MNMTARESNGRCFCVHRLAHWHARVPTTLDKAATPAGASLSVAPMCSKDVPSNDADSIISPPSAAEQSSTWLCAQIGPFSRTFRNTSTRLFAQIGLFLSKEFQKHKFRDFLGEGCVYLTGRRPRACRSPWWRVARLQPVSMSGWSPPAYPAAHR